MDTHRIFKMSFASVYPLYIQKAEKKGRKKKEVDEVICWLTGYSPPTLAEQIKRGKDFAAFFSGCQPKNSGSWRLTTGPLKSQDMHLPKWYGGCPADGAGKPASLL